MSEYRPWPFKVSAHVTTKIELSKDAFIDELISVDSASVKALRLLPRNFFKLPEREQQEARVRFGLEGWKGLREDLPPSVKKKWMSYFD